MAIAPISSVQVPFCTVFLTAGWRSSLLSVEKNHCSVSLFLINIWKATCLLLGRDGDSTTITLLPSGFPLETRVPMGTFFRFWVPIIFSHNFSPLYFKELAHLDKFSKNRFLGSHLWWRRSPLGPHLTQNRYPLGPHLEQNWVPMALGSSGITRCTR